MEKSVYNSLAGFSTKPAAKRNRLMMPLLPKILIQAKLLMTELVIRGKIETDRRIPLHFFPAPADKIRGWNSCCHTDSRSDEGDLNRPHENLKIILILEKFHIGAERIISGVKRRDQYP